MFVSQNVSLTNLHMISRMRHFSPVDWRTMHQAWGGGGANRCDELIKYVMLLGCLCGGALLNIRFLDIKIEDCQVLHKVPLPFSLLGYDQLFLWPAAEGKRTHQVVGFLFIHYHSILSVSLLLFVSASGGPVCARISLRILLSSINR